MTLMVAPKPGWEAIWYTGHQEGDYPYQAKNYQEIKKCIEKILGSFTHFSS